MKKITFYLVSIISTLAFLMTSCLGDTKTTISPANALSYITTQNYTQCALTTTDYGYYYITSPFVKGSNISQGKFYYLRYNLNFNDDQTIDNVYQLTDVGFGTSGTFPIQEQSQYTFPDNDDPNYETLAKNDDLRLTGFSPYVTLANNAYNDKWIFSCSVSAYPEDYTPSSLTGVNNIQLNIVKQPSEQVGLEKNQAIFNVYLSKAENIPIGANSVKSSSTFYCVVDLNQVRSYFNDEISGATTTSPITAYMQFQYYKYDTNNNKYGTTITKVGSLTETSSAYGMYINGAGSYN